MRRRGLETAAVRPHVGWSPGRGETVRAAREPLYLRRV
ncbi:hypothetical protein BSIN_1719 [Burkholderia singularis]|uniref:Uncharacterized protein n=1 Tax=Burkholderia singularis TaxID=1503053 RepID=A0A238GZP4_9BURK|nr:hypothetical protein BSIN_1719 [Burkholderia singularis]